MATRSSSSFHKQDYPSFFKVFRDSGSPHLTLPSAFVRSYLKQIPKNPIIKTARGGHQWRLKLVKIDGYYCLAFGWKKFVEDFKLKFSEFLIFWLIDPATFQVLIFDKDGCEKDLPSHNPNSSRKTSNVKTAIQIDEDDVDDDAYYDFDYEVVDDDENDGDYVGDVEDDGDDVVNDDDDDVDEDEDEEDDDDDVDEKDDDVDEEEEDEDDDDGIRDENPCFQKTILEKTHKYTMRLPKNFVEETGIGNKSVVTIKDLQGREWLVRLFVERYQTIKYILTSGWSVFREYNHLSCGDICLFKFIKKKGILVLAKVIKNKHPRKQESREKNGLNVEGVKRKRGRPPREKSGGGGGGGNEMEVVKRKRGRPPRKQPHGGGVGGGGDGGGCTVKIEEESEPKMEVVKRKRGRPPLKKHGNDGGVLEVKREDESNSEVEAAKMKRGRLPLQKHSGGNGGGGGGGNNGYVEVKMEEESTPEVEVVKRKRGRPRLDTHMKNKTVIYF